MKWPLLFLLVLWPVVIAAVPVWKIEPQASSITFSAVQNNAPVSGEFKKFTGEISFSPGDLRASRADIKVDMNSVTASYSEVSDTLKATDWFNVKLFPEAIFKADKFISKGGNRYQVAGTLTLRDKTVPVILTFTLDDYSTQKARVHGSTRLKRTAFGVGIGEWAKTDVVKDEVEVNFNLVAVKD